MIVSSLMWGKAAIDLAGIAESPVFFSVPSANTGLCHYHDGAKRYASGSGGLQPHEIVFSASS